MVRGESADITQPWELINDLLCSCTRSDVTSHKSLEQVLWGPSVLDTQRYQLS